MADALKPCPFCGGDAFLTGTLSHAPQNAVRCTKCTAVCGLGLGDTAISQWNRRVPAPDLVEALLPFAAAVDECEGAPDDMAIGDASYAIVTVADCRAARTALSKALGEGEA